MMVQHYMLYDFQGIWISIAKEPYSFAIFQGVRASGPPPLRIRAWILN